MAGKQCVLLLLGIASVVTSAQSHMTDVDSGFYQHKINAPQKANNNSSLSPGGTKGTPEAKGLGGSKGKGGAEGTGGTQASGAANGQNGTSASAVPPGTKPDAGQAPEK